MCQKSDEQVVVAVIEKPPVKEISPEPAVTIPKAVPQNSEGLMTEPANLAPTKPETKKAQIGRAHV